VMGQFLHHRQPEDGLVGRMYQDMNPDEAEKDFALGIGHRLNIPPFDQNRNSIV